MDIWFHSHSYSDCNYSVRADGYTGTEHFWGQKNNTITRKIMKTAKLFLCYGCATAALWMLYSLFETEECPYKILADEEDDDLINWI